LRRHRWRRTVLSGAASPSRTRYAPSARVEEMPATAVSASIEPPPASRRFEHPADYVGTLERSQCLSISPCSIPGLKRGHADRAICLPSVRL
jgi:hypothetical protein